MTTKPGFSKFDLEQLIANDDTPTKEAPAAPSDGILTEIAGVPIVRPAVSSKHIKFFLYGKAGVGKTVLAASADNVPEMSRPLVLNTDRGSMSLEDWFPDEDIVANVSTIKDLLVSADTLRRGGHQFKTVVVDSFSKIAERTLDDIARTSARTSARGRQKSIYKPERDDWGELSGQLRSLLDVYLQLDMNVIFISGARTFDDGGRTGVGPDLQGNIKDKITYAFDLFFYMFKDFDEDGNVRRVITTEGTKRLEAKSRSRWMPAEMVNPTMQDIYDVFRKAREGGSDG